LGTSLIAIGCTSTTSPQPIWPPKKRTPGGFHDPDSARGRLPGLPSRKIELVFVRKSLDSMYAHRLAKEQRYVINEDELFSEAEGRLFAARTWAAYDDAIYLALARFRDGHLSYHPPPTAAPRQGYESFHLGLTTVLAKDHLLVASVDPDGDVAKAGVAPGDDVVAIDEKPTADVLAKVAADRVTSRDESAKTTFAKTWSAMLIPKGDHPRERTIRVARRAGGNVSVRIAPRPAPKVKRERVTVERDGDIAIVTIRSLEGAKPQAKAIDDALAKAREAKAIVIDLRGNRGGIDLVGFRVVAGLAAGKAALGTYRVLLAPETLARRTRWKQLEGTGDRDGFSPPQTLDVDALPNAFAGKVAVIVDAGCVSTCEVVTAALRADVHATIIGETTGGSSGAPVEVVLPASGSKLLIPTWDFTAADGKPIEGDGVVPDVEVVATPDALANGIDLPRQTALDRVRP
jgi:C-terminal processing protease CtpA/Prc